MHMPLPSPLDFSALVSESLCSDPLFNRVKWEFYLPAHRNEFITRKLSEMARCRREFLQAPNTSPEAAKSSSSKTTERSIKESTTAPAAPEAPFPTVDVLSGFVMKTWCDFFQLASGARTWIACFVVFYICAASSPSSKQLRRRAVPCGWIVLTVLVVMLHLLSTVGAGKVRSFRNATANVWSEVITPTSTHRIPAMTTGPDGSLYVFDGGKLFKLHLDTKEWNIITTAGSVQPSSYYETESMVTIGNDLYLFGVRNYVSRSDFFRLSTTTFEWELLDAPRISGSPPSARNHHGMVVVGNDIYVFGGISGEEGRCTAVHRRVYDRQSASIALRAAYHDRSHGIP